MHSRPAAMVRHPFEGVFRQILSKLRRPWTFGELRHALPKLCPLVLATSISELRTEGQITSDATVAGERFRRLVTPI